MRNQQDPNSSDSLRVDAQTVIDAFNGTAKELADQNAIVMREMMQTYGKAAVYNAFMITLPAQQQQPILLAGFDLSRMKVRISTTAAQCVIGHWEETSNAQGFYLPVNAVVDFETTDEIYIRNQNLTDVAYVSVWVEKSAQ